MVWVTLAVSLLTTGLGLFSQYNRNQQLTKEGDELKAQAIADNALLAAKNDAAYMAAMLAQQQEKQAAALAKIETERKSNQIITAALLIVFLGLIGVAIFRIQKN